MHLPVDDPSFLADPYSTLTELRESTPIFWNEPTHQWMVTRFDDVARLLRDRRLGRVYTHRFSHEEMGQPEPDPRWGSFHDHERWSLLGLESPVHTRLRRLVSKVFTPRAVAGLESTIRATSDRLLADCREAATFDLLSDFAQPLSVDVICSMLGVPTIDGPRLLAWSHAIVKMYELNATDDSRVLANQAAADFMEYIADLISQKRQTPDDLLVSALVGVSDEGDRLSDHEIICTTMVLLEAGHEASVNTLGNGVVALMHQRDQWARLTAGEVDAAIAVEELLRWDPPLQLFARWVLEPGVRVGDREMKVGEQVAMLFGSAQRDPRRFADPTSFDIGRNDPSHVGFGGGIHFCVGAPLARLELSIALDGLAKQMPQVRLAGVPTILPTFVLRGFDRVELKIS